MFPVFGTLSQSGGQIFSLEFHGSNKVAKRDGFNLIFYLTELVKLIIIVLKTRRRSLFIERFDGVGNRILPKPFEMIK